MKTILLQETRRGKVHACPEGIPVILGRDSTCRIVIDDRRISRRHCELYCEPDGRLRIADLSTFGTSKNGLPVEGRVHAVVGDRILVGKDVELVVLGVLDPAAPLRNAEGHLWLPRRVPPHYLLLRGVGRGAAGLVYEAWNEEVRRRCAIKLLVAGGPATAELMARFKREALLQAKLGDWPGIVAVRDFGTLPETGELFFAMDYVPGQTLRQRIKAGLERDEGLRLVARVARAVSYAHERGIVHRDLKPSNVMVSDEGTVRLTDFGVCKALEDHDGLTATGVMLGTPNFMAPEQVDDSKRVGPAADIYGLGGMLYNVLTREVPYRGSTVGEVLDRVAAGDLTPPRTLDPQLDPDLAAICERALAVEPEDRHPSALDLARAIEDWLAARKPRTEVRLKLPDPKRPTA